MFDTCKNVSSTFETGVRDISWSSTNVSRSKYQRVGTYTSSVPAPECSESFIFFSFLYELRSELIFFVTNSLSALGST